MTILLASVRWWKSHRPIHWTLAEHLKQPTVNCRGEIEFELAEAVASALREDKKVKT